MTAPSLFIFDCDGVLIDSEVISARQLIEELKGYGVDMDMTFVSRHFLGRSYPVVLKEVRERWGVQLPDRFEADYRARLLAAFERDLKVMPGVVETLRTLAIPYCLATSSSPERMRKSLEITGLTSLFEGLTFTASEVARASPHPISSSMPPPAWGPTPPPASCWKTASTASARALPRACRSGASPGAAI
jgi:beta-phosphoglucomutase-like phosphatase (HAD superfamily)